MPHTSFVHKVMQLGYFKVDSGITAEYVVAYIAQDPKVATAGWWGFIPRKRTQLTDVGFMKVNESIRAYVYALLGAQSQIMSSVFAYGTGLDARRQFITIVESLINAEPDLEKLINQFQDILQYEKTPLNFVVGPGLYFVPSDMDLRISTFEGYYNNLQIATVDMKTGYVQSLNLKPVAEDSFKEEKTESEAIEPISQSEAIEPISQPKAIVTPLDTSLTIGAVTVGVVGFMLYKILT